MEFQLVSGCGGGGGAAAGRGWPLIIQGGMGVGVSGWRLARAVSRAGQLGVVSGTALAVTLARRLQLGDEGGHLRRALERFPVAGVAGRILKRYFVPGGKAPGKAFVATPMPGLRMGRALTELTVAGNFAEVWLAKEGHGGLVGINYLEKLQIPTLASLLGAMLAGVDYVLMGAGVPRSIPGVLDRLSRGEPAALKVDVEGRPDGEMSALDPSAFCGRTVPVMMRPTFLAVVSSATLATALARKSTGKVDGFVVEGHTAGGHNAPPRRRGELNERGEPRYGEEDVADLRKIAGLGSPFWLAGSWGGVGKLAEARALGATGVQVGTAFALCAESGVAEELKRRVIDGACADETGVVTDGRASPTGFPFKVLHVEGTLSDPAVFERRKRRCDMGYLRTNYARADGTVGYRCPAEPVEDYVAKGGDAADTVGRKCLCNGLTATVGLGQVTSDGEEPAIVTSGEDLSVVKHLARGRGGSYTAADVVASLLNGMLAKGQGAG